MKEDEYCIKSCWCSECKKNIWRIDADASVQHNATVFACVDHPEEKMIGTNVFARSIDANTFALFSASQFHIYYYEQWKAEDPTKITIWMCVAESYFAAEKEVRQYTKNEHATPKFLMDIDRNPHDLPLFSYLFSNDAQQTK